MRFIVATLFVLLSFFSSAQKLYFYGEESSKAGAEYRTDDLYVVFDIPHEMYHIEYYEDEYFAFFITDIKITNSGKSAVIQLENSLGKTVIITSYPEYDLCYVRFGDTIHKGILRKD